MKRWICTLLSLALLLSGCAQSKPVAAPGKGDGIFAAIVQDFCGTPQPDAEASADVPMPEEDTAPSRFGQMFADLLSKSQGSLQQPDFLDTLPPADFSPPAELEACTLYQEALARPHTMLLYNYHPLTDSTAVDDFLLAVETGGQEGTAELLLYSFRSCRDHRDISLYIFRLIDGVVSCDFGDESSWEKDSIPLNTYTVDTLYRSEYDNFVFQFAENRQLTSFHTTPDSERLDNIEIREAVYAAYMAPIKLDTSFHSSWSSSADLTDWIWIFEDLFYYENGYSAFELYGNDWPLGDILALLNRYFDNVTAEMVCADENAQYDESTRTLRYDGRNSWAWGACFATDWRQEGNLLYIYYNGFSDYVSGAPTGDGIYLYTIRLEDDGSFRYLSNQWLSEP